MTYSFLFRSKIVVFCFILFSLILLVKLFLVQVVRGNNYSDLADRQYVTPADNIYERGTIFFQGKGMDGKEGQLITAAAQTSGFKLAINPSKIVGAENIYQKLAKIIALDHDDFTAKAKKTNDPYEEVANHLSKEQADKISTLKIPSLSVFREKWRFYPGETLASHVLGFVGYKDTEIGGRYGLERFYDKELARENDDLYVNFFAEVFSDINRTLFKNETKEGDVITTIEPTVQNFLEKKLKEVGDKYNVDSIGGIIMNPVDGSIYAMGASPDFNPNNFSQVKKISTFSNPLVENVLEFGSVIKPLVMAAALDAGVVTAETTYNDRGSVVVEKKEIFNFDKKARGVVNMQEVLNQSLNTGMVYVESRLGRERLRDYLLSYGIRDKTGIDLPNETSGLVSNILTSPREIEYANAAFGQGIALTPIGLIRALSSLSNGGNLVVPHVVKEIRYFDGTSKKMTYPTVRTKIKKETSEEITRMLVAVMDEAIGGEARKLEHFIVAVKTGTAQIPDNTLGGYHKDKHTHSFFGYFPAYDPKFIVLLYAVNPKGVSYAATTWSVPFLDITKFLLNYYEIPPDR